MSGDAIGIVLATVGVINGIMIGAFARDWVSRWQETKELKSATTTMNQNVNQMANAFNELQEKWKNLSDKVNAHELRLVGHKPAAAKP